MTPPILARVAQLHGSTEDSPDTSTITTTTSWEYVSKSSSLSDLTRFGAPFSSHPTPQSNLPHSSVFSSSQINTSSRGFLPHGIVHLPPAHRGTARFNNGFQGYRLTQEDLLQPQQPVSVDKVQSNGQTESIPVMRSTSFNLDCSSARKYTNKFRAPVAPQAPARKLHNKPAQKGIVFVAENPENGACDVYNVPFSSDIYSMPVDSIATRPVGGQDRKKVARSNSICTTKVLTPSTSVPFTPLPPIASSPSSILPPSVLPSTSSSTATKASSISQQNGNQRLKLAQIPDDLPLPPPPSGTPSPPQRKNNLNRRHSREEPVSNGIDNIKCPPPPVQALHDTPPPPAPSSSTQCKPPQRWSSLQVAPALPSPPKKEEVPPPPIPKDIPPTPPPHSASSAVAEVVKKPEKLTTATKTTTTKPRSRSVDPKSTPEPPPHSRLSSKTSNSNTNRHSTYNLNQTDNPNNHPLPPEPVESSPATAHSTTGDRRNPLGLSFLNLFRRNKNGGKQQTPHHSVVTARAEDSEKNYNWDSDFMAIVPSGESSRETEHTNGNTLNNNKEDGSYCFRELPPPPPGEHTDDSESSEHGSPEQSPLEVRDFAASIERVKDCGWYWGPLSSEAAEDLLKNEPDGSFIVRDSSDARYIFSLTFKLHGLVRHVRIEHDQGNFSFGPLTRFKAATIVDFVEKAVAHSRSGRYLFFLHRRPVLGPMQVQLLHPYSRFMHPRSLKHMCRFVILKYVRRDLIHTLPLPKPLQDYLNTPHYYFEPSGGSKAHSNGHPPPNGRAV